MLDYQEEYIANAKEAANLFVCSCPADVDFDTWLAERRAAEERIRALRERSTALLSAHLFPALDSLHGAAAERLQELAAFADQLMNWQKNIDTGLYVVIHDALLSLCRVRRDRNGIIRELYKLGMGMYYQRRMLGGIEDARAMTFHFQNEMVFTEASSYLRYYDEIEDEETRGYIIRATANIAICVRPIRRRIAATSRVLRIIQDEHYRALAPGLNWNAFLTNSHKQMSSNRASLSRGDLTREELAAVLDSCYEVFKPEDQAENPSIRWMWPYYEMEYNCGYVGLEPTLKRLERLLSQTPPDQYDMAGLYGNIQLALVYGKLISLNEELRQDPKRIASLDRISRKMIRALMTVPVPEINEEVWGYVSLIFANYFEFRGALSYQEAILPLMKRYGGAEYLRGRRVGLLMRILSAALLNGDPAFFDDIPFLAEMTDSERKRRETLTYAENCGLYLNLGLIKMSMERIAVRGLFENEGRMARLHPATAYDDLKRYPAMARYAEVALGHHAWYNGGGGYPADYARTASPYRQMTDVAAVAAFLEERWEGDMDALLQALYEGEGQRFSPLVTRCVGDGAVRTALEEALRADDAPWQREIYDEMVYWTRQELA